MKVLIDPSKRLVNLEQLNQQVNPTPQDNFTPFEVKDPANGQTVTVSHNDPIKLLKTIGNYDGNPNLLNHWLSKARRLKKIYKATNTDTKDKQACYYTFLLGIETKIVGAAFLIVGENLN